MISPNEQLDTNFGISVRRAITEEDWETVLEVRWNGYGKYCSNGCKYDLADEYDNQANCTAYIVEDDERNAVGTARVLDRRYGSIELDKFIDVDSVLPRKGNPCVEGTRFSIPGHPHSALIKFACWKGFYRYCKVHHIPTAILSVRYRGARDYQHLQFEHAGESGIYYHSMLGNKEHHTYLWDIPTVPERLKAAGHPLYNYLRIEQHPKFIEDQPNVRNTYFEAIELKSRRQVNVPVEA